MSNSLGRGAAKIFFYLRNFRADSRGGKKKHREIGAEGDGKAICLGDKYFWQSPKAHTIQPEKSLLRSPMSAKTGGLLE